MIIQSKAGWKTIIIGYSSLICLYKINSKAKR